MIKRHQLVWLNQPPVALDPRVQKACDGWLEAGLPFVATRQRSENELRLGFCIPRQGNHCPPQRIGVVARKDAIVRISLPPLLAEVTTQFEALKPARYLVETKRFHLYGSYMWEFLTQQSYTTSASDLDVFVSVEVAAQIPEALACFKKLESFLPIRIDGEVSIRDCGEINWRELLASSKSLLLKTSTGAMLINREEIPCLKKPQSA